jgi:hypothetical protein
VTIAVTPDAGQVRVDQTKLTFTPDDWSTARTITVTAVDDELTEGSHAATITHSASSTDGKYNGIPIADVTVNIADNEQGPDVTVESVDPNYGSPGQRLTVKVLGANFQQGATASFGEGIAVQKVTFVNSAQLDVTIKIQRRAALGSRDVTVTNPDGSSGALDGGFLVDGTAGGKKNAAVGWAQGSADAENAPSSGPSTDAVPSDSPAADAPVSPVEPPIVSLNSEQPTAATSSPEAGREVVSSLSAEMDAEATVLDLLKADADMSDVLNGPDLRSLT